MNNMGWAFGGHMGRAHRAHGGRGEADTKEA